MGGHGRRVLGASSHGDSHLVGHFRKQPWEGAARAWAVAVKVNLRGALVAESLLHLLSVSVGVGSSENLEKQVGRWGVGPRWARADSEASVCRGSCERCLETDGVLERGGWAAHADVGPLVRRGRVPGERMEPEEGPGRQPGRPLVEQLQAGKETGPRRHGRREPAGRPRAAQGSGE